ncbi:MAG: hypothetical protein V5804_08035 [Mucilaginibacter sp.]|uniref:hypothetical protein n=1 Tax=Mucilaginibacter sp. TaxID=1882438 RepID=UPI0034E4D72E
MEVSDIQLFQILKEKVGEQEAKTITEYIETKIEKQPNRKSEITISNADFERRLELSKLRTEFYSEINKSKIETIQLLFFVVIVLVLISTMLIGLSR